MELGVTAAPASWVSGASSFPKQAFQDRQQESAKIDLEKSLAYCNSSSEDEEEHDRPVLEGGATRAAMQASKPQISGRLPASSVRTGAQASDDGSSGSSSEGRHRHGEKRRRHEKDGGGKKSKTGSKKSKRHSGRRERSEREEYLRAEARARAVLGGAIPERRGGTVWAGGDSLVGYALGYSGPDSLDKHLMCTDRCGTEE